MPAEKFFFFFFSSAGSIIIKHESDYVETELQIFGCSEQFINHRDDDKDPVEFFSIQLLYVNIWIKKGFLVIYKQLKMINNKNKKKLLVLG